MNYTITVFSKNKTSLVSFFKFFNKELKTFINSGVVLSQNQKKTRRKIISILKSPHVNKTAQMHFSLHKFSKQIHIFSPNPSKFFLFIKKIQSNLFPDIRLEVKSSIKLKHVNQLHNKFLNPNKFFLNKFYRNYQIFPVKKNAKITSPLERLVGSKSLFYNNKVKAKSYELLCNQLVSYFKIWDCYGEAVLLGFEKGKG